MKLRRMISTMLALLLAVSLLPVAALAEETVNKQNDATLTTDYDKNTGFNVTVPENITVGTNEGSVYNNNGTVETNKGRVWNNYDTVKTNEGTVGTNNGTVETNTDTGLVAGNEGTVKTNNGTVWTNNSAGTIKTNDGTVGDPQRPYIGNSGTIETNNGTVLINQKPGTVETNNGTVEENYGTVETNAIDGVVNNYSEEPVVAYANEDAAPSKEKRVVLEGKVENNFGTVVDKTNPDEVKTYYGLSWGDNVQSLTLIDGRMPGDADPVDLNDYAAKASRSGYRMTGFTAYSRVDGADKLIEKPSGHVMNAPVWLYIMWQELGGTDEPQPTRTPVYANLSADQVRVGTFVRLGGCVFKIIEVNDDSIRVATVNKLPGEALTDMLGFLKQYLSDAQIAKLTGEPELLEQELVAKFFGGTNEHIAFYAARDLFA